MVDDLHLGKAHQGKMEKEGYLSKKTNGGSLECVLYVSMPADVQRALYTDSKIEPSKCSCFKLTIIALTVFSLMISIGVILGYWVFRIFNKDAADTQFTTKRLVYDRSDENDAWVVIQRREKGDVNFTRTWEEYKYGFGSRSGDFWFGNENIHILTTKGYNRLRIQLSTFDGHVFYFIYDNFSVSGEDDFYRLQVSAFKPGQYGLLGDCMTYHDDSKFSTYDSDNDQMEGNCAQWYFGGWWYDFCQEANLNGIYRTGDEYTPGEIIWCFINKERGIKHTKMSIQQKEIA